MNTYTMKTLLVTVLSAATLTISSSAWAGSFATADAVDTTAPVLTTTPAAQSITGTSALITWGSNKVADSRVYFGTALPLVKVAGDIEYATSHSVKLTKLSPNTSYSYQVVSVDPAGNKTTGAVQTFTTNTSKTSQIISFAIVPTLRVGQSGIISATASSGLDVTLLSGTPSVCSVATNGQANQVNVTGVAVGSCGIVASQAGDVTFASAADVTQYINIQAAATAPSAPTITSVVAGSGRITINFDPPLSNGGASISSYTATCSAANQSPRSATGTGTKIVVGGLVGGVSYSCMLTASNGSYSSVASAPAATTPAKAVDLTPMLMLLLD